MSTVGDTNKFSRRRTSSSEQTHTKSAVDYFSDRQAESAAFAESVISRDAQLTDDTIEPDTLNNILHFHGYGGVGKTKLSEALHSWVTGQPQGNTSQAPQHWGELPQLNRPIVAARWELNDSHGYINPIGLILDVREALQAIPKKQIPTKTWRAFDLAFGAYARAVGSNELTNRYDQKSRFKKELPSIVAELAFETGMAIGAGVGAYSLREISEWIVQNRQKARAIQGNPDLPDLLERCLRASTATPLPDLAPDILFLLTQAIDALEPKDRPLIVVFVDHFERVQLGPTARQGEQLMNTLIAALPHGLFVVTGRDRIDWHEGGKIELAFHGPNAWPCLTERTANPRTHFLERLSDDDARDWISGKSLALGLPFDSELIDELVTVVKGWPVHIDAIFTSAQEMASTGKTEIAVDDLGRTFSKSVQRLLEHLPSDEVEAFQAACLLPYFNSDLVNSMTGLSVSRATVNRLASRSIIVQNPNPIYPLRVHDELRSAVKLAGPHVTGGWTAEDWQERSTIALRHAVALTKEFAKQKEDHSVLAAIGLAITISAEYGISEADSDHPEFDALAAIRRKSPSFPGLLPLVPPSATIEHPNTKALVQFIETRSLDNVQQEIEALKILSEIDAPIALDAKLWCAYRLRADGRYDESIERLKWLREHAPDKHMESRRRIYSRQLAVTYSIARRFADAEAIYETLDEDQRLHVHAQDQAKLGLITDEYISLARERLAKAEARFSIELDAALHRDLALVGRLDRDAALEHLDHAIKFSHAGAERMVLVALGIHDLAAGRDFNRGRPGVLDPKKPLLALGQLLAFRALRDGVDSELLEWHERAATRTFRGRGWISVEMLLDHLGLPLPPVETQWPEPVEDIRARWVGNFTCLLEQSEASGRIHGDLQARPFDAMTEW